MSNKRDLYIHVQPHAGGDILRTLRIPHDTSEAVESLKSRAAAAAAAAGDASASAVLCDGDCGLFLDDTDNKTSRVTHQLASYPDGGDVFARVAPCVAAALPDVASLPPPPQCRRVYVHFAATTRRYDGFVAGTTTFEELLRWFASEAGLTAAAASELVGSHDLDGSAAATFPLCGVATVSDDGDLFLVQRPSPKPAPEAPTTRVAREELVKEEPAEGFFTVAEAAMKGGRGAKAIQVLRSVQRGKHAPADVARAKLRLAALLCDVKRFKEAAAELEDGIRAQPRALDLRVELGRVLHRIGDFEGAADAFKTALSVMTQERIHDEKQRANICIHLGGSLYELGLREGNSAVEDRGIDTVQRALNGNLTNSLGLLWMSRFYARKGLLNDALQVACRLCCMGWEDPAAHSDMKEYKRNLAAIMGQIGETEAVGVLRDLFTKEASQRISYEMWAFFATNCRDHGLMKASLLLYEFAMTLSPQASVLVLNYAHGLENVGNHIGALRAMRNYVQRTTTIVGGVRATQVLQALDLFPLDDQYGSFPPRKLEHVVSLLDKPRMNVRFSSESVTLYSSYDESAAVPFGTSSDSPLIGEGSVLTEGLAASPYSDEQLSLLAIYFTIVKNLYIVGALGAIPPLLQLLNPLRVGKELHRTVVRNEHAYFLTVAALMQYHDFHCAADAAREAPTDMLYVCGDSHSLAPSWHTILLEGKRMLLVNAIVTGLKMWHLREDCSFYPRRNFEAVIKNIPNGAQVIFLFGEIDCREGIVQAVERGMYASLEEALDVISTIYIQELLRQRKRFSRVFVHLPLPTINVTSKIVLMLCKVLAAKLEKHPGQLIPLYCHVVDDASLTLRREFQLDGTHISPTYMPLLQSCINEALVATRVAAASASLGSIS